MTGAGPPAFADTAQRDRYTPSVLSSSRNWRQPNAPEGEQPIANVKLEPIASFVIVDPKSDDLAAAEQSATAVRRGHPVGADRH